MSLELDHSIATADTIVKDGMLSSQFWDHGHVSVGSTIQLERTCGLEMMKELGIHSISDE
jgi:hypothetical protein